MTFETSPNMVRHGRQGQARESKEKPQFPTDFFAIPNPAKIMKSSIEQQETRKSSSKQQQTATSSKKVTKIKRKQPKKQAPNTRELHSLALLARFARLGDGARYKPSKA